MTDSTVHQFPYTHDRWNRLLSQTVDSIKRLAEEKGGEYAGDTDRLANFRRNAAALELQPEQVWSVYAGKHWDAIQQWIKDTVSGKTRPRSESISGRADDLIVYLLLLKAMVEVREGRSLQTLIEATTQSVERICQHEWRRFDRHSDICVFCNSMKDHR